MLRLLRNNRLKPELLHINEGVKEHMIHATQEKMPAGPPTAEDDPPGSYLFG